MAKTTRYPDTTLVDRLRGQGYEPRILWQQRGPPNTLVVWQECYSVGKTLMILQTFKEVGWQAFFPLVERDTDSAVGEAVTIIQASEEQT